MADAYKVKSVGSSCCSNNVKESALEKACDRMAGEGYRLVLAYEAQVGCCCCAQKASVLFFEKI